MKNLVAGLLQMSRITRSELNREKVNLSETAHSIAQGLMQRNPSRLVDFQIEPDVIALGEHHRPDFAISAPDVVLATIAGRTSRIHLGSAVTVLSSDDPIRVFQRFSTLNALSNGRAEVILGRGSFIESFPLFGLSLEDYEMLFEEKLDLFVALLRQELRMIAQYRWWLPAMQASVVTTPLISLLVWRGAIARGARPPVGLDHLTTYLVLVSLVTVLTSSWTAAFLAESIRSGRLNTWLVRPCSTHLAAAANNVGEKVAKLATLLPLVVVLATPFHDDLRLPAHPGRWLLFSWALVLGATLTFSLDVIVGSLAFWWQDVTAVDRLRHLVTLVLSGALIPLAVMPAGWGPFLLAQPFGYVVAFPVRTLLEPDPADLATGFAVQATWVVLAVAGARVTWVRGLRRYHGAGA